MESPWDPPRHSAEPPSEAPPEKTSERVEFTLNPSALQRVVLRTGWLSFLTVGFYRFWMKTQIRLLVWSSAGVRGDRFEYTGTPVELLLGSMIAVVILAAVLGAFNLAISFVGLAIWQEGMFDLAFFLSFLVALPLIQFAVYRARRYRLLRTRFRGIRFGMDGSALRFVGIWAIWGLATLFTLGLAYPWMRVARERYMSRHMLYGDARFSFEGSGRALLKPWLAVYLTSVGIVGVLATIVYATNFSVIVSEGLIPLIAGPYVIFWLFCRYRASEIRHFIEARRVAGVALKSEFKTWGLLGPYWAVVGRNYIPGIPVAIAIAVLVAIALNIAQVLEGVEPEWIWSVELISFSDFETIPAQAVILIAFWISYGLTILFFIWVWSVVFQRRYLEHLFSTMTVIGLESLDGVRQRTADDQIESEGFADALDVGGL